MDSCSKILLSLISCSLFDSVAPFMEEAVDWQRVSMLAQNHMIVPLLMDGSLKVPSKYRPLPEWFNKWRDQTIRFIIQNENLMASQNIAIGALHKAGIPCAILKGCSIAALYPKPELRILGDIDILVERMQFDFAVSSIEHTGFNRVFEPENKKTIDEKRRWHIEFIREGIILELHHSVSDIPGNSAGIYIKSFLQSALVESVAITFFPYTIPVLSLPYQAISLLLHKERHLTGSGIGLRQLCDWAVFVHSIPPDIWVKDIAPVAARAGLLRFARVLTRTCILYLGLPAGDKPWCDDVPDAVCSAMIEDILSSGNLGTLEYERALSSNLISGGERFEKQKSGLSLIISNMNRRTAREFPASRKYPVIMPVYWVLALFRLRGWIKEGKRKSPSIGKVISYSRSRKKLHRELRLFRPEGPPPA